MTSIQAVSKASIALSRPSYGVSDSGMSVVNSWDTARRHFQQPASRRQWGGDRMDTGSNISSVANLLASRLHAVEGVDAAFLDEKSQEALRVYVIAREHGIVDRDSLIDIEDEISEIFDIDVDIAVRAHQSRIRPTDMMPQYKLLFGRG